MNLKEPENLKDFFNIILWIILLAVVCAFL